MKIRFICACGLENYNKEDWLAHWRYGLKGKRHALFLFLNTRIELGVA